MHSLLVKYLPTSTIHVGKIIKKKLRQLKRHVKFGSKSYVTLINLPETQFKIVIHPSKNACVDETIALQGYWEKELTEQLTKQIKPGDTFLDIGANIGYHSLFVASLLKNTGQVHAFEPIPNLSTQIKESVEVNQFKNISVHNVGLGSEATETKIYLRDENMGGSSLSEYKDLNLVSVSSTEKISIVTLDSLLTPETRVNVIKIDVEGYEFEALKGAQALLKAQHPVIFMEFSPMFYKLDYAQKSDDLIKFLTGLGYTFETMSNAPIKLEEWLRATDNPTQIDVICR